MTGIISFENWKGTPEGEKHRTSFVRNQGEEKEAGMFNASRKKGIKVLG